MSKSLIALAVIAAGAIAVDSQEVAVGAKFDAPDDVADKLVAAGQAKLAEVKSAKKIKVRLLVDSALGNCNDVVDVEGSDVKKLEADGLASSAKGEVDYALSLPQNKA
ncbi:hypothetical protein [uncultured Pseudacidovorax sp.]|uniref:hypothetical protein n=1 Tax=uncultured Pseudacidovorax sp. TaxID=679313 RepID=UPI0025F80D21|nr:hypothetical protein [uncultured Pseudacidovorax sp.]